MQINQSTQLGRWKVFLGKFFSRFFVGLLLLALLKIASLNTEVVVSSFLAKSLLSPVAPLSPMADKKKQFEVFGFAPHWSIDDFGKVDFSVLTTLAYFGVEVDGEGRMDTESAGYTIFLSDKATDLFQKAHENGTRVVLTLTQMDNAAIESFMDDPEGQKRLINEAVALVKKRGIDGINVDFEYMGDPGEGYANKFSFFVKSLTEEMHRSVPGSKVTVSVYASATKYQKLYDIASLGKTTDGIFMMAYDFSTSGSDNAMPTAPLYGHKEGKYWYDVSTAVEDFLALMPSEKLILGVPWYGYNFPVTTPEEKAEKYNGYYSYYWWRGKQYSRFNPTDGAHAQTYASAQKVEGVKSGWDDLGKVGWKAYKDASGVWRMVYYDDPKSLSIKYNFAKEKKLAGVGIWSMAFDGQEGDLWAGLKQAFGTKLADSRVVSVKINDTI